MKEQITKFNLEAAFKALNEIEMPKVSGMKANKPVLKESLKPTPKTDCLLEDYYDVNSGEDLEAAKADRAEEVAQAKLAKIEKIVDLDAETPEDIQPSYVGKTIIQCPQCMTLFYRDPTDVNVSEEDPTLVNVGEKCPNCNNESGYTVIGKVAAEEPVAEQPAEETSELDLNFEEPESEEETVEEVPAEENGEEELNLEPVEEPAEENKEEEKAEEEEEKKEESFEPHSENILAEQVDKALKEDFVAGTKTVELIKEAVPVILDYGKELAQIINDPFGGFDIDMLTDELISWGIINENDRYNYDALIRLVSGYFLPEDYDELIDEVKPYCDIEQVEEALKESIEYRECEPGKGCVKAIEQEFADKKVYFIDAKNLNDTEIKIPESTDIIIADEFDRANSQSQDIIKALGKDHKVICIIAKKDNLKEEVNTDELTKKLKEHDEYIKELQEYIKKEEEAVKNAKNEFIKKMHETNVNLLKDALDKAIPEEVKAEAAIEELPTAEDAAEDMTKNEALEEEKCPVCGDELDGKEPCEKCKKELEEDVIATEAPEKADDIELKQKSVGGNHKGKKGEVPNSIVEESLNESEEITKAEIDELLDSDEFKTPVSEAEFQAGINREDTLESLEEVDDKTLTECITNSLTAVYENVNSFELTDCEINSDKFIVEGKIHFKSGLSKDTKYIFTESINNGHVIFEGKNETLDADGKFTLTGTTQDAGKILYTKSLAYNYHIGENLVEGLSKK